jgi:ABC-type xylose transport system permease subunit
MSDVTLNTVLLVLQFVVYVLVTRSVAPMSWEIVVFALSVMHTWMKMAVIAAVVLTWAAFAFFAPVWVIAIWAMVTVVLIPWRMRKTEQRLSMVADAMGLTVHGLVAQIKGELKNVMKKI